MNPSATAQGRRTLILQNEVRAKYQTVPGSIPGNLEIF